MTTGSVLQFKITLLNLKKPIWRQIQIDDKCTFWGLHVAIQDAMGWLDIHLHEFIAINPETFCSENIGIPADEEFSADYPVLPGWEVKVNDYIHLKKNAKMLYIYDFGDGWKHMIQFEGIHKKESGKYPKCLAGQRACPPEDVGGTYGFEDFLTIIKNPKHKEHTAMLEWVGGEYYPEKFNHKKVKFDPPEKRLQDMLDFNFF